MESPTALTVETIFLFGIQTAKIGALPPIYLLKTLKARDSALACYLH